jgi:hypothetical protein
MSANGARLLPHWQQINRKIQGFSSGVANSKEDSRKLAAHLATSQGSLQGAREPPVADSGEADPMEVVQDKMNIELPAG